MADGDRAAGRATPQAGRRRNKSRIGAANVDRILDAALSAFARNGLHGTRIDEIAEAAGMSKTNLLYYFRSKDALYKAVLTRTLEVWLTPLRALDAALGPEPALTAYITEKLLSSRRYPEASRLFAMEIMQGAPHLGPILAGDLDDLVRRKVAIIRGWIEDGAMLPVDPYHLLFMIWATTQHYADFAAQIRVLTGKDLDDETFYAGTRDAVVATLLKGVLAR